MMSNFKISVRSQRYPALASCGCYTSTLNHRHLRNLEWLAKYPSVWRGYRLTKSVLRNIFHMMQACGFYSYATALVDAAAAIRKNIERLKRCNADVTKILASGNVSAPASGWTVRASQSVEQWELCGRAPVTVSVVYGMTTRCVTRRRTISDRGESMMTWYYKAQSNSDLRQDAPSQPKS